MLGGEVPDLATTPCGGCGGALGADDDVVWDAWYAGDPTLAAYPYHRACAGAVLPPAEADADMRRCGLCGAALSDAELEVALRDLRARFEQPKVSPPGPPQVVWRLAAREPRRWVPEHFACLLAKVERTRPLPGLPGKVISPGQEGD